jgi:hypothetical protein
MKTTIRITLMLAALALMGPAAFAQGATGQETPVQTADRAAAAQAQKQIEAEAALKALDAQQAAAAQAKNQVERAKKQIEQAQKQQGEQAKKQAMQEAEKALQDALAQAARQRAFYAQGTAALDQERYEKALQAFAEAAALKGARGDGALYWKAYAEFKLAAMQAGLQSLRQLQTTFPDSRWLEQARALEFELQHASGAPVSPAATPDEELKLLALNSLVHTDSEQALPMLEKMIVGPQPPRLKKRALFVLSQSKSPKAREILTSVAKGSSGSDLQIEALQYLQMFGGADDKKLLSDVYAVSKDRDVKARILEAYMVGGEQDRLLQLARSEADPKLRLQAIRMLGVMNAPKSAETLAGLYWIDGQSKEVRWEIIDALFVQANARALVDLARKETDPATRKRIVERLSVMKSKEASDFMMELISK